MSHSDPSKAWTKAVRNLWIESQLSYPLGYGGPLTETYVEVEALKSELLKKYP